MASSNEEPDLLGLYERCYESSEKTSVSDHFKEYRELLKNSYLERPGDVDERSFFINQMAPDVDGEKLELLEDYCSIDNLNVPGEIERMSKSHFEWCNEQPEPEILDSLDLQTVRYAKQRNKLKAYQLITKYKSERPIEYQPTENTGGPRLTPGEDVIVYVRIYMPFTSRSKQSSGAFGKLVLNSVVAILGSQTLDKLRDIITCESDNSISVEMSDKPVRNRAAVNAKDVYKSGFFFIEDTFYNDFRDPSNKDNSSVIRNWAKTKKLGNFKVANMENTRIDSLNLRFGFPWVYQHQGDCEHLVSFSNARLVNPSDELNVDCYPRIVVIKSRPIRYCMTCGMYNVNWITTSNNRLPHNPCLFCDSCFKSYNYKKGHKIGDFKAYPYPYDVDLKFSMSKQDLNKYCKKG